MEGSQEEVEKAEFVQMEEQGQQQVEAGSQTGSIRHLVQAVQLGEAVGLLHCSNKFDIIIPNAAVAMSLTYTNHKIGNILGLPPELGIIIIS